MSRDLGPWLLAIEELCDKIFGHLTVLTLHPCELTTVVTTVVKSVTMSAASETQQTTISGCLAKSSGPANISWQSHRTIP